MGAELPLYKKVLNKGHGYWGMVLCLISSFLLSMGTMMVHYMKHYDPITKSFWRFGGTFIPAVFVYFYYIFKGDKVYKVFWPMTTKKSWIVTLSLFFRSFFGCTGATFQYYSLKYMPIADSSVICNAYPIIVSILACVFLKERFGVFSAVAAIITVLGVAIIARPPMLTGEPVDESFLIGSALACGCAIFLAGAIVMIRHLKEIHHSVTLVGFGFWGTVESALLAWYFGVFRFPEGTQDIIMAIMTGILSCGSQMFLIWALKCDTCGPVALVKTTDVLFAFLWQITIFDLIPDLYSIAGALTLISGILLAGFIKWIDGLDEKNSARQKLAFLLI